MDETGARLEQYICLILPHMTHLWGNLKDREHKTNLHMAEIFEENTMKKI
jgi:hypothetical protein